MPQFDIFIDESGIFRKFGHSVYCLTISDTKTSVELDQKIIEIEKKLKIAPFHWRNHVWKIKSNFLAELLKLNIWNCKLVIINNNSYSELRLQSYISKSLEGIDVRRMYIDGKKHKSYINDVKKSLKKVGIKVNELKMVRHQAKGGLRISDAVAGLARLHYDEKTKGDSSVYYEKFLKQKIAQVVSDIL